MALYLNADVNSIQLFLLIARSQKVHQPFTFIRKPKRHRNHRVDPRPRSTPQPHQHRRCLLKMSCESTFHQQTMRLASARIEALSYTLSTRLCSLKSPRCIWKHPVNRLLKLTKLHPSSNLSNIITQIKPFNHHHRDEAL